MSTLSIIEAATKLKPFAARTNDARVCMSHVAHCEDKAVATDGRIIAVAKVSPAREEGSSPVIVGTANILDNYPNWKRVLVPETGITGSLAFSTWALVPALEALVKAYKAAVKIKDQVGEATPPAVRKSSPYLVTIETKAHSFLTDYRTVTLSLDGGGFSITLEARVSEFPCERISFNAEYLLMAAKATPGNVFYMNTQSDNYRAVVLRGGTLHEQDRDFEVVLMPVKMSEVVEEA